MANKLPICFLLRSRIKTNIGVVRFVDSILQLPPTILGGMSLIFMSQKQHVICSLLRPRENKSIFLYIARDNPAILFLNAP